ncbi:MAG: DUF192 domain-containing protein [Woeseiaceae bacterium]
MRIIIIILISALLSAQNYEKRDLDDAFDQTTLVISSSAHACYVFDVYVAANQTQQRRGLMFVRNLPEFTGMIFIYEQQARLSMWMKNTYIPLDILFISATGDIANIVRDTVPLSLNSIAAVEPVNYVLELNAGLTEKLGIDNKSQVIFTAIAPEA